MNKYSVIVAAAGKAERFGGSEKKTFAKLDGRPLFLRCLELFVNRPEVCQILLAVSPEDVPTVKTSYGANLGFMGVTLAEGGAERVETVRRALAMVSEEAGFVAVHDAARPCVTAAAIDAVFAEATKSGAAILAAPVTGTLKRVSEARIVEETVSRAQLYEAQTPQVFRKDVLTEAYAKLPAQCEVTDDAQVVERAGHAVSIVISDATNLKITARSDLALASALLKARPAKAVRKFGAFEEAQW